MRDGDPRVILGRLMAERHPVYAEADLCVDSTADVAHEVVVAQILQGLARAGALETSP